MDDIVYDLYSDTNEKKSVARSAFKKGGRRKKCSMPSDYLSRSEKEKLNGEVKIMNLNAPMRYSYFKTLSKEMQEEYYNNLVSTFGATNADIARMMGTNYKTLFEYCKTKNLDIPHQSRGARLKKPHQFKLFCDGVPENKEEISVSIAPKVEPVEKNIEASPVKELAESEKEIGVVLVPSNIDIFCEYRFKSVDELAAIFNVLANIPIRNGFSVKVTIGEKPNAAS